VSIEHYMLLGGLLFGMALGFYAGLIWAGCDLLRKINNSSPRACVRLARLCISDLCANDPDLVIQLFRARAALHQLACLMAASRRSALRDRTAAARAPALQPTANSLQPESPCIDPMTI
jgi:hypothetical protein